MPTTDKKEVAKHTPGPWLLGTSQAPSRLLGFDICPSRGEIIAHVRSDNATVGLLPAEANARLIAAAPDLLAMCQRMLTALNAMPDKSGGGDTLDRQLTAVITKATGTQP